MILTRRISLFLITAVLTGFLFLLYIFGLSQQPIFLLVFFLATLTASYFLLFRHYGKLKFVYPKFIYWILLVFLLFTFPNFFLQLNFYVKVIFILFCGLTAYVNGLAINIYLVAERKMQQIPLLQSAKLVISTSIVGMSFLGATVIYKINFLFENTLVFSIFQSLLFIGFYYLLFEFSKWFYYEQKIGENYYERLESMLESLRLFSIVLLAQLSIILNFFPFEDIGKGMIIASTAYVLTNLAQAMISRSINKNFAVESYSIIIFIYLLAYFL